MKAFAIIFNFFEEGFIWHNQQLRLLMGQQKLLSPKKIYCHHCQLAQFSQVTSGSRCPNGVPAVWRHGAVTKPLVRSNNLGFFFILPPQRNGRSPLSGYFWNGPPWMPKLGRRIPHLVDQMRCGCHDIRLLVLTLISLGLVDLMAALWFGAITLCSWICHLTLRLQPRSR